MTESSVKAARHSCIMAMYVWLLLAYLVPVCLGSEEYLYYTSPGDFAEKTDTQGLWGGPFDIWNNGTATNLTQTGIYCANMQRAGFYKGINTRSIGYDPGSKKVIINMQVRSSSRTAAFTTPICTGKPPQCKDSSVSVLFAQAEPRYTSTTGHLGPFAMWNNTIYFVVNRYENAPGRTIRHTIELRMLDGCEDRYPFKMTYPIDIESCSVYMATFAEELGHDLGLGLEDGLSTSRQLYIYYRTKSKRLVFLTQIQNQTFNDAFDPEAFSMSLVSVTDGGDPEILHHQELPVDYAYDREDVAHLGSISYRDGILCWTVWDRILCASWDGQNAIRNLVVAVPPNLVAEQGICTASGQSYSSVDYSNIITGIAIGDATRTINLVFGCYAGKLRQGGAGLLRVNKDGSQRQMFALTDDNGRVLAGSMFFACGHSDMWVSSSNGLHEQRFTSNLLSVLFAVGYLFFANGYI